MENFSAHNEESVLRGFKNYDTKVHFFPPNLTHLLQLVGVSWNKPEYCKLKVTKLDVITMVKQAWDKIDSKIIK